MRNGIRKSTLVFIAGALLLGLSACDLSEDNIEAPGVSSTSSTV